MTGSDATVHDVIGRRPGVTAFAPTTQMEQAA